jgi:methylmalonyl-CoA mutase cobalamin-binding domain/chain
VVYEGIRLTPSQIVRAASDEAVHVVGLSILSGSHVPLVEEVVQRMRKDGLDDVPLVVGGIIPPDDADKLKNLGVAAVFTPKDFQLNAIMRDIVRLVDRSAEAAGFKVSSRRAGMTRAQPNRRASSRLRCSGWSWRRPLRLRFLSPESARGRSADAPRARGNAVASARPR